MTKKAKTLLAFHLHEGDAVHCCLLGFLFCFLNFFSMEMVSFANSLLEPHLSKTSKQKACGFFTTWAFIEQSQKKTKRLQ